jgi:hypothetical protein
MNKAQRIGNPRSLEQFASVDLAFIRDAAEDKSLGAQRIERRRDSRVKMAGTKQVLAVALVEGCQRTLEQIRVRQTSCNRSQRAPYQHFNAVTDPAPGLGETRPAKAGRVQGLSQAVCEVRR